MESLTEAAERELEEETGLKTKELLFHNFVNAPRREGSTHYLHINFEARGVEGNLEVREPDKCYEWRWFGIDNLPHNIFIGHQECIPAYIKEVTFNDHFAS